MYISHNIISSLRSILTQYPAEIQICSAYLTEHLKHIFLVSLFVVILRSELV